MGFSIFQRKRTRQPQGAIRLNTPVKFDFAWVGSQPRGSLIGPAVQSTSAAQKATSGGLAISNGYSIVASTLIPSLYTTSWTEVGSVLLNGTNEVAVLSARNAGQPVRFVPASGLISLVLWGVVDVNISGTLPTGVVNYVVRRSGSSHTVWLNGKLFGTASVGNAPTASDGTLPAIGAQAGSGGNQGIAPLVATTGVLMVARTGLALPESQCLLLSANPWQLFAPADRDLYFEQPVSGGVTASLVATLPQVTLSGVATVDVAASLSATLPQVSLSSAAAVAVSAGLTTSLPQVSLSSTATVAVVATLNATLPQVSLDATFGYGAALSLNVTLPQVSLASTATVAVTASEVATLPQVSLSSAAAVSVIAGLVASLPQVSLSASFGTGTMLALNATLPQVGLTSTAAVAARASLAATLPQVALSATIELGPAGDITATLNATLQQVSLLAQAYVPVVAGLNVTLPQVGLVARASGTPFVPSAYRTYTIYPEDRAYSIQPEDRALRID